MRISQEGFHQQATNYFELKLRQNLLHKGCMTDIPAFVQERPVKSFSGHIALMLIDNSSACFILGEDSY